MEVSSRRKYHLQRHFVQPTQKVISFLFLSCLLVVIGCSVCYALTGGRRSRDRDSRDTVHNIKDVLGSVMPPQVPLETLENSARTLFFLPGKENRCMYQYDYVCKFWFYIRCYIYGTFPNVHLLSLGPDAISEFMNRAEDGDIGLIIWRSKNHSNVPQGLSELIDWKRRKNKFNRIPRVRIGVFHIANEKDRTDWPWYTMPDFIIRNYWIPNMSPHVTYVPLGPQMPNQCIPRSTQDSVESQGSSSTCDCQDLQYKRASKRKYVWNFTGSLRKKRAELLRRLRKAPDMEQRGYVQIAKKFGGDGVFGSITENPKNAYLNSILESQFVFAPCGNAMETHRIYEALSLGAIPVVENCDPNVSHFFPFSELLIDGGPEQMIEFVRRYMDHLDEIDGLQLRVTSWWSKYAEVVSKNVSRSVRGHIPATWKRAP